MIALIEVADKMTPVGQIWLWGILYASVALLLSLVGRWVRLAVGAASILLIWVVVTGSQETGLQPAIIDELGISYIISQYSAASLPLVACLLTGYVHRLILRVTSAQPNLAMQRTGLRPTADRPNR